MLLAENAATISYDLDIEATTEALTITPNAATVAYGAAVNASAVSLTLTENSATISHDINVLADCAALSLTAYPAVTSLDVSVDAGTVALNLTTYSATIVDAVVTVHANAASLTLAEQSALISYDIDVSATTEALTLTTYDAAIWDGAAWSAWISANLEKITYLYYFVLTGDADGTTDVTIPISSWQARRKSGAPTYLSVVAPGTSYQSQIEARTNGTMKVNLAYVVDAVEQYRETVCEADYEYMRVDEGGRNQSITLTGHKTETFTPKAIDLQNVIYVSNDDGNYRYRCAVVDMYLNPGDTARYDGNEITVAQIVCMVAAEGGAVMQSMDVNEVDQ